MTPTRTPEGKWRIYERTTGQVLDRWPVDARGMLESGAFTADPPESGEAHTATVTAAPQPPPVEVPLVITRAHDAAPGQPLGEPVHVKRDKR